jgi:hypothetical protein
LASPESSRCPSRLNLHISHPLSDTGPPQAENFALWLAPMSQLPHFILSDDLEGPLVAPFLELHPRQAMIASGASNIMDNLLDDGGPSCYWTPAGDAVGTNSGCSSWLIGPSVVCISSPGCHDWRCSKRSTGSHQMCQRVAEVQIMKLNVTRPYGSH